MAVSVVEVAIDISEQCAIRDTVRKALTFFLNKALCSLYELERQENLQEELLFHVLDRLFDLEFNYKSSGGVRLAPRLRGDRDRCPDLAAVSRVGAAPLGGRTPHRRESPLHSVSRWQQLGSGTL